MRQFTAFVLVLIAKVAFSQSIEVSLENYPFISPYQATLSSEGFSSGNERFDVKGNEYEVSILVGRPELRYKIWMQEHAAPAIIIIPGFVSHYRGDSALALANLFYQNGFHTITIANPMNYDFSRPALTGGIPGYPPSDTQDLHRALAAVTKQLNEKSPGLFQNYNIVGYSSGALYTLFLAALESQQNEKDRIGFQSYLAINPPVDPDYSLSQIDESYRVYKKWSDKEKKANYLNFVSRIAAIEASKNRKEQIEMIKSFSDDTLRVAIGSTFRLKLAALFQVAYADGYLDPLFEKGYLKDLRGTYSSYSRRDFYKSIEDNYDFSRYIHEVVVPYYQFKDPTLDAKTMLFRSSLYSISDNLRTNPLITVIHNKDDVYMHNSSSLEWLKATLKNKLILFDRGGHVGNLYMPQVQEKIIQAMRSSRIP
ncbi:MAG: hypothetical protein A4S09_07055 [Proteobacteria bacterium SG_bin7]|nr:MAG: hypothetical protein A4S09_07055 [Proteobacteria bacterium SG_bin7]